MSHYYRLPGSTRPDYEVFHSTELWSRSDLAPGFYWWPLEQSSDSLGSHLRGVGDPRGPHRTNDAAKGNAIATLAKLPRCPNLGRLVGEILDAAHAYDDDPMSANAPSECRVLAWRGTARRIRTLIEGAGFSTPRALEAEVERRVGAKCVYLLGLSAILSDVERLEWGDAIAENARAREEAAQAEAALAAMGDDERTCILVLYACPQLPMLDLGGKLRGLGLLLENGTISLLGMAVAKRLLADDPEARS